MAKIIEIEGVKIVGTYCEHMATIANTVLGKSYSFCPKCGQKLHKEEPTVHEVCSACRLPVSKTNIPNYPLYCIHCGAKFDGSD